MKTLKNHLILYDEECPMCAVYTQAFVKSGMLEPEGRASYQKLSFDFCSGIDPQRAVKENARSAIENIVGYESR